MSTLNLGKTPHVAMIPSAGMGHLIPFLRLATMLASRKCTVTIITPQPTVSTAESNQLSSFFAAHPCVRRLDFHILPYKPSTFTNDDPFFIQYEAFSNSVHLLQPLLSSLSPPPSAIFTDIVVGNSICQIADNLSIETYILITSSAKFLSLMAFLPHLDLGKYASESNNYVELPGLAHIHASSIPPLLFNPNHYFAAILYSNVSSLLKVKGILINSFTWFESETIEILNTSRFLHDLAPVLTVGPLASLGLGEVFSSPWLDEQPAESVVYVSFGSRTAMSKDQIQELASGLASSTCKFLWVLKANKVDKDDKEDIDEILGNSFLETTRHQGKIVKEWVNQEQILAHPAIGGFISHCGWNSVMEAAKLGVPILAWPHHGDQKINAEVSEKAGLALWAREWDWGGQKLVQANEIAEKIKQLMHDKTFRAKAKDVGRNGQLALESGGSSGKALRGILEALNGRL